MQTHYSEVTQKIQIPKLLICVDFGGSTCKIRHALPPIRARPRRFLVVHVAVQCQLYVRAPDVPGPVTIYDQKLANPKATFSRLHVT